MLATDDPRANGNGCLNLNANLSPSPDDPWVHVQGHMWGTARIAPIDDPDCTISPDYWEGTFVGDHTADGNEQVRAILRGHGVYNGLQMRMDLSSDPTNYFNPFFVAGEILDPGGH
jgi:hypothetical protein